MLSRMSAAQFGRWTAFYRAEYQIRQEAEQQAALEREALSGVDEIRSTIRE